MTMDIFVERFATLKTIQNCHVVWFSVKKKQSNKELILYDQCHIASKILTKNDNNSLRGRTIIRYSYLHLNV